MNAEESLTSEFIAGSVNTNPVVIRRLLGTLRGKRLVTSQGGNGGGWRLALPAESITLRLVYQAVECEPPFRLHSQTPNPDCPVGRNTQGLLTARIEAARRMIEEELARTTIAGMLRELPMQVE